MVLEESDNVNPTQTGLLLVGDGVVGVGFTVTETATDGPVHPETVDVTEYVPVAAVVAPAIVGSSAVEVKLFGPVQL